MHASGYARVPITEFNNADALQYRKWRNFRKLVLRQGNPDTAGWELEDFSPSDEVFKKYLAAGRAMADFSTFRPGATAEMKELAGLRNEIAGYVEDMNRFMPRYDHFLAPVFLEWSRSSRKIFSLTSKIQQAFENVDLGEATWRNIPLPFRSFAIEFAEPMVGEIFDQQVFVHGVIVADVVIAERESLIMLPLITKEKNRTVEMYSSGVRTVIDDAQKSVKHLLRASQVAGRFVMGEAGNFMDPALNPLPIPFDLDAPIVSGEDKLTDRLAQTVARTCAYLVADSHASRLSANIEKGDQVRDGASESITDPEEIFLVGDAVGSLEDEVGVAKSMRRYLTQRASPKRHPVRKHFRRPPGSPPDAPKTIEVKAQWRGKIPNEGELPIVSTRKID